MIATMESLKMELGGGSYPARWWRPGDTVPTGLHMACDTETTPISAKSPWVVPQLVLLSSFNGTEVVFVGAGHAAAFFAEIPATTTTYWHNFAFDYQVLLAAGADLTSRVEAKSVTDTMILHRLYTLATHGNTGNKKGESTLENCADLYCGLTLAKDPADRHGQRIRTGFGRWLGRRSREVWPEYLEYAGKDVIATARVAKELLNRIQNLRRTSACHSEAVYTFLGNTWLNDQWAEWGPLTHHIQLRATIVLDAMSRAGFQIDRTRASAIRKELQELQEAALVKLAEFGYVPGPGSQRKLQALLLDAESQLKVSFRRTEKGRISTKADDLTPYADRLPFVAALRSLSSTTKMLTTYTSKLLREDGRITIHPRYDFLKTTGRISSQGELAYMSMPRASEITGPAGRLRSCIVPCPGHAYVDRDFSMIELITWAAVQARTYGHSALGEAIKNGGDLHTRTAAGISGKPESQVTKVERKAAKAVSFGLAGGLGVNSLATYINSSFAANEHITADEAAQLKQAWLNLYPPSREYLAEEKPCSAGGSRKVAPDTGLEVASWFNLTPAACRLATGLDWFRDAPPDAPHGAFGNMLLKALMVSSPSNARGRVYDPPILDFLWSTVQKAADERRLPAGLQPYRAEIKARRSSIDLGLAAKGCFGRGPVWTPTGRLRANATYTQRCNTPFQGLAADGLKLVLWRLYREGLRPVLAVHDQLVVEAPTSEAKTVSQRVESIMVAEMKKLVGELPVTAPGEVRECWG